MSGYIGNIPVPQATQTRQTFTATASQTTFNTAGYTAGFVDVYMNGVKLVDGTDFTATNGSDVVLTSGAAAGDVIEVVAYSTYQVNSQNYTGGVTVDNDGATVLTVDRATSDGTIIDVQKDGTTVGSIGARSGMMTLNSPTYYGLKFYDLSEVNIIHPVDHSGSSYDNQIDLGYSGSRFKDLYLSGGVYLGGTGSANKLDDYEEGTWTPTVVSGTLTNLAQATYTKIGNVVHCEMKVNNFSDTTSSTVVEINLPFASFSADRSVIATSVLSANVSGLNDMNCYMDAGNVIRFYSSVTGGAYDSLLHSDLNSASTMYVGFSYFSS